MDFIGRTWIPDGSQSHQILRIHARREEFLFVNGQKTFGNTRIGPSQRMRLWDSAFIWEKAFYVTIFKLNCSGG